MPVVALVGYTNAGKSTLLNQLTDADVLCEDQLFATLDPTTRRITLPSGMQVCSCFADSCHMKIESCMLFAIRKILGAADIYRLPVREPGLDEPLSRASAEHTNQ